MGNRTFFYQIQRDSDTNELMLKKLWSTGRVDTSGNLKKISIHSTYRYPSKMVIYMEGFDGQSSQFAIFSRKVELVNLYPHFSDVKRDSLEAVDLHWHREWLTSESKVCSFDIYNLVKASLPKAVKIVLKL